MLTSEAAAALGLTAHTVRVQINNGRIKARKVGRDYDIAPREVERYRAESLGKRRRQPASAPSPAVQAGAYVASEPAPVTFRPVPKPSQRKRARAR